MADDVSCVPGNDATTPDAQRQQVDCLLHAGVALVTTTEYVTAVERLDAAQALYGTDATLQ